MAGLALALAAALLVIHHRILKPEQDQPLRRAVPGAADLPTPTAARPAGDGTEASPPLDESSPEPTGLVAPADAPGHAPDPVEALRQKAAGRARAGKTVEAINLLEEGLSRWPGQDLLTRDLSRMFALRGWERFNLKDYDRALGFFSEALYYWPENHEAMRGAAYVHYQERDLEAAENLLRRIIDQGGDRPEVYTLLGRICYETDRLKQALHYFQVSLAQSPEQPELTVLADRVRREFKVEKDFESLESRHFQIKFEGRKDPAVARMIEEICKEAYASVGSRLGLYPQLQITVILYTDQQFSDITRMPAWAGAVFDGKIRLPARGLTHRNNTLVRIIYHEFTHALIHDVTRGRAPVWLHEGLAQIEEGVDPGRARAASILVKAGGPMPLTDLEKEFVKMPKDKADLGYLQSWLAAVYLEDAYGPYAHRDLLRYLGQGDDIRAATRRLTGRQFETFDDDFQKWIAAWAQALP